MSLETPQEASAQNEFKFFTNIHFTRRTLFSSLFSAEWMISTPSCEPLY